MNNKFFSFAMLSIPVGLIAAVSSAAITLSPISEQASADTELVLSEGAVINVKNGNTSITVTSGKGFDRTYAWGGCELKSHMSARTGRWFGSIGIYDPALSFQSSSRTCSGISRTVVEEGQMHFDDMQFVYRWIEQRSRTHTTVWTNDGILVSWSVIPSRAQLNVDVFMVCINGKRPKQLVGATDDLVSLVAKGRGPSLYECTQVANDVPNATRAQLEEEWRKYSND